MIEGSSIIELITQPFLAFFEPQKRLFWGNILGSLFLILLISGSQRWHHLKILFSPKIWWHASSRADMKIIAANSLLRSFVLSGTLLSSAAMAALVSLVLTRLYGDKLGWSWSPTAVIALYAVCVFVADDFARFYLHYLQHRWRWLWVFHQTHHSALVLTPLTLMRTHPVEILSAQMRDALVYGTIGGVFFFAFGQTLGYGELVGMQLLGLMFNFLGANLRHSQVWLHFGPLEGILISPAAHQVHHSADPAHYDRNFGVCLAVWDRLWGSFFDPRQCKVPLAFGLRDSILSSPQQSLWNLYVQPFKDLLAPWKRSTPLPMKKA